MAAHRKFIFDNPEDSYWNANGPLAGGSLFNDIPSSNTAAAARAALDNLFESQVHFGSDESLSNTDSERDCGQNILDNQNATVDDDRASPEKAQVVRAKFTLDQTNLYGQEFSSKSAASIVSDGSVCSFSSDAATQLDYSRLKNEHRKLQKHLEQVRSERFRAADAELTIKRLLAGDPVTLDLYRTKHEKMNLLDAALNSYDGDVITAVVIFLRKTLNDDNFIEITLQNTIATQHYLAYLKEMEYYEEMTKTLISLGRSDEAVMLNFAIACRKEPNERVQLLKKGQSNFNNISSVLSKDINEYIDLLERQIAIEAADEILVRNGQSDVFQRFPKTATLIGRSVLTTFYYSCLYHYDLPVNAYASPLSIKQIFQLTDKQYVWMAVSALSRLNRWNDVELVLTSKKLLGGVKISCPFPWQYLFRLITAGGEPPKELLCKLLRAVPDVAERRRLASEFPNASEISVECLVDERDRIGLTAMLAKLTPNSSEARKALSALSNAVSLLLFIFLQSNCIVSDVKQAVHIIIKGTIIEIIR